MKRQAATLKSKPLTSSLTCHALRLLPEQDIKMELIQFAKLHHIKACCVISCVGSVHPLHIRLANQKKGISKKGYFEILSLSGTLSSSSAHLHLAVADKVGKVIGGHLMEGTCVYTTAEVVLGILPNLSFDRQPDAITGYKELVVRPAVRQQKKS